MFCLLVVVCYFCVLLIGGCCIVYRNTCFGLWDAGLVCFCCRAVVVGVNSVVMCYEIYVC